MSHMCRLHPLIPSDYWKKVWSETENRENLCVFILKDFPLSRMFLLTLSGPGQPYDNTTSRDVNDVILGDRAIDNFIKIDVINLRRHR